MKEIIFGVISGVVASMGMGGGVILVLLFSLFSDVSQHIVQGINLIFFIPTSIVAIYMNIKNKNIDYKVAKKVIISGIIGACIGSLSTATGAANVMCSGTQAAEYSVIEELMPKVVFHKLR